MCYEAEFGVRILSGHQVALTTARTVTVRVGSRVCWVM